MTDTKWTEGPWSFSNDGVARVWAGIFHIVTAFPTKTASKDRLTGESWLEMYDRTKPERNAIAEEAVANAHLIAAAPELYEALDDAIFNLEAASVVIDKHDARALKEIISSGKDILAKARGEDK